ncbi:hypothetical protein M0804_006070 [Polistes exclamans]|nr:hypothetical protein M0804_006070 [Polistes exclamans]
MQKTFNSTCSSNCICNCTCNCICNYKETGTAHLTATENATANVTASSHLNVAAHATVHATATTQETANTTETTTAFPTTQDQQRYTRQNLHMQLQMNQQLNIQISLLLQLQRLLLRPRGILGYSDYLGQGELDPPQFPDQIAPRIHPRRVVDQGVLSIICICPAVKTPRGILSTYSVEVRGEAAMPGHQLNGVKVVSIENCLLTYFSNLQAIAALTRTPDAQLTPTSPGSSSFNAAIALLFAIAPSTALV